MIDKVFWKQVQAEWTKEADMRLESQEVLREKASKHSDLVKSMMNFKL